MDSTKDDPYNPKHHSYFVAKFELNRRLYKQHPLIPPLNIVLSDNKGECEAERMYSSNDDNDDYNGHENVNNDEGNVMHDVE